jgi:hypothetical protein
MQTLRRLRQEIARKRSGKLTQAFCSCPAMRQLAHPKFRWLLQLIVALEFFPIPHILRT